MISLPPDAKGVLFVVSTSHMDWHWLSTFEQYYTMGYVDTGNSDNNHFAVRYILDQVKALLPVPDPLSDVVAPPDSYYRYNLAEVAWLRRYLQDNPEWAKELAGLKGYFSVIGGGITSADSLLNNGEVFIRNFLIGRDFIRQKGLAHLLTDVCWVPDDFGTDPQLPVVLKAMGFKGVSFARVPGWQANQNGYYPATPADQNQSLALATNGVTFQWAAADSASVLAYYMLCVMQNPAYGYPWAQDGASADNLNSFITANNYPASGAPPPPGQQAATFPVNQPGQIMMTPSGGDFAVPSADLVQAVQDYNTNYYPAGSANYNGTGVYAVMGTFEDFVDYVLAQVKNQKLSLQTLQGWNAAAGGFDPSSYWTGHFANYVQLKVTQQRTANRLLAIETLSTLLRASSHLSDYLLDGLNNMILTAWNDLVPSTHHDYVNGTAPTAIYQQEQLPLLNQALRQAETALEQGMHLLGASVNASPGENEIPYVVFNPAGTARTTSQVVEIPASSALSGMMSYYVEGNSSVLYPIQHTADGSLLILVPDISSMGYTVVYFSSAAPNYSGTPVPQQPADSNAFYMSNGLVQIAIDKGKANGWALSSILVMSSNTELTNGLCNEILVYSEGYWGNPYQMGNEYGGTAGFTPANTSAYTISTGSIVESGPYRWRFSGEMKNKQHKGGSNESQLQVEYLLELNDPLIRVRVKGNAEAKTATSVVTTWRLNNAPSDPPAMSYGTANHWNGPEFTPYWSGPVFRATHDFLTLSNPSDASAPNPLCAMYHEGMRAWAFSNGQLQGILLRNTNNNGGRGAQNADTGTHTQHYAFRIPGVGTPESCQPLQESIQFQIPLVAAPLPKENSGVANMNPTGYLASVTGPAILRLARTRIGSGRTATEQDDDNVLPIPFRFVLRLYQPTNATAGAWAVNVPFINNNSGGSPVIALVTALEEPIPDAPVLDYSDGTITFSSMETLTTLQIQSWGPKITPPGS